MKIHELKIRNFRGIDKMDIDLDNHLNVFCGINGVGKSSVLDAIALQLSWIIARIRTDKGSGKPISEHDIKNGTNFSEIEMMVYGNGMLHTGLLVKNRRLRTNGNKKSYMGEFSYYAKLIRQNIIESNTAYAPVFIYYTTNRVVTDIPLRIRSKHEFSIVETYDNALSSGVTFRSFFEWYRNREDLENQLYREEAKYKGDYQLGAVRSAIEAVSGFKNVSVKRNPLHMEVLKGTEKLILEQLSDGEKCLFAMAGDMARRLAIANPLSIDPLKGEGIVLIDEIDLHLHPQWQKMIIPVLLKTFSNIQFVISTHSPQILSEVEGDKIFSMYKNKEGNISYYKPKQGKGLNSNEILEELMETSPVNKEIKDFLEKIFNAIDDSNFDTAETAIDQFKKDYGSVPELVRAETLLTLYLDKDSE